ncbi:serine hydrolase domain-containing protein [Bacillus sp. NTK074B]|uniref:serine hydrolase domain-containing protein n=1 Tax=Bacillus sp. NTK074B TaxID=2802174 RepID=UPI001FD3C685
MEPLPMNLMRKMEEYRIAGVSMAMIEGAEIRRTDCFGSLEIGSTRRVDQESIFNACSISKFFTSMLVMTLSEQGILHIDEDVSKYLSTRIIHENLCNEVMTLRHLLSHQSGIVDPINGFGELNTLWGVPTMQELLEGTTPYFNSLIEAKVEPGSDFSYSDAGYCMIQLVIENIMGKSFQEVIREHLFQPLQLNQSTYGLPSLKNQFSCGHTKDNGLVEGKYPIYPYPAACGLWTTPTEVAIMVMELMTALKGESNLLTSIAAEDMIKPQGGVEWMGLGVFLDLGCERVEISSLGWGVGFQCMMVANPYEENGLVIMTNTDTGVHQLKGLIGEVYRAFIHKRI